VNLRPKLLNPSLSYTFYPNDTFTYTMDLSSYFTDDPADTLTYSLIKSTSDFSVTFNGGTMYTISANTTSLSGTYNFTAIASDGVSLPTPFPIELISKSCDVKWTNWYGGTKNECYSWSAGNFLYINSWESFCPSSYYALNSKWENCHTYCKECSGPGNTNCQKCNPGAYLLGSTWDTTCPKGYFENSKLNWVKYR